MGIKLILTFFVVTFFGGVAEIRQASDIMHRQCECESTTWEVLLSFKIVFHLIQPNSFKVNLKVQCEIFPRSENLKKKSAGKQIYWSLILWSIKYKHFQLSIGQIAMRECCWLSLLLLGLCPTSASSTSISENGYRGVVIAVSPEESENPALVKSIKELFFDSGCLSFWFSAFAATSIDD